MALNLLAAHQAAENLLTCVCSGLGRLPADVPGLAGCPCRVFVSPGVPAADGCDSSCTPLPAGQYPGQLTVHVVRAYSSTRQAFPRLETNSPDSVRDLRNCQGPPTTAVELMVTLYRCVPGMSNEGCPPAPEVLTASAMQTNADLMAIQSAVLCCYAATDTTRPRGRRFVLGQAAVVGPQGDCVGVQTAVTLALDDCLPCPPVVP